MKTQQNGVLIIMQLLLENFRANKWKYIECNHKTWNEIFMQHKQFFLMILNFPDKITKAF